MTHRIRKEATEDLFTAFDFYEQRQRGLGMRFVMEVGIALAVVLEAPHRWPEIAPGYRKYRLNHFPFALIYRVLTSQILELVAVFDLRRDPGSWRENLGA